MFRVGRYDAFDKWDILSRYWEDQRAVPDLGLNRFERPCLQDWQQAALHSGTKACVDYISARANGISRRQSGKAASPDYQFGVAVNDEVSELLRQIGHVELQGRIRAFAEAIAKPQPGVFAEPPFSPALANRIRDVFKGGALRGLQWTNETDEVPNIEVLREQASSFPKKAIRDKCNILSLFSAWFYGRSDVIHIHDSQPNHVTLVDSDRSVLEDMKNIYPRHWTYVDQDYKNFLREAAHQRLRYDAIVSDPFKYHGQTVAWDLLPLIMELCTDIFVTNYFNEMFDVLGVGAEDLSGLSRAIALRTGVEVEVAETLHRSPDVHWVVIRKVDRQRAPAAA